MPFTFNWSTFEFTFATIALGVYGTLVLGLCRAAYQTWRAR